MGRLTIRVTALLFGGLLLAACGQSAATPVPAKPTSTPVPTSSATLQATPGVVLLDESWSGSYRSNTFTTSGQRNLIWEAESAPSTTGSFVAITVFSSDGTPVASTITIDLGPPNSKKNDAVPMHYAGTVFIDIQGVGNWHVKAVGT